MNYGTGSVTSKVSVYDALKILHGPSLCLPPLPHDGALILQLLGSLMILAWGLFLPFGMLWGRYARRIPNDMRKDAWFVVRLSAFLLTLNQTPTQTQTLTLTLALTLTVISHLPYTPI